MRSIEFIKYYMKHKKLHFNNTKKVDKNIKNKKKLNIEN